MTKPRIARRWSVLKQCYCWRIVNEGFRYWRMGTDPKIQTMWVRAYIAIEEMNNKFV